LVTAQVLTNDDGSFTVQALNVNPQADYYLRVSSDTQAVGNYAAAVDFRATAVTLPTAAAGALGGTGATQTAANFTVIQSQQIHVVLSSNSLANKNAVLKLTVRNSAGAVVYQLLSSVGDSRSGDIYLTPGTYSVTVAVVSTNGSPPPATNFRLDAVVMTDPVGASASNSTSTTSGSSTSSSTPPPSSDLYGSYWTTQSSADQPYWY
jgi:hypothetical protein